jgi:hypothetical protein
MDRGR